MNLPVRGILDISIRRRHGLPFIDSPDDMTPDERLHEIATILARGVLRLRAQELSESVNHGLDVAGEPRLNVTEGLTP